MRLLLVIACAAACSRTGTPRRAPAPPLAPGVVVHDWIAGGEQQDLSLSAGTGDYIEVEVLQEGQDVAMVVRDPWGAIVAERDHRASSRGPEIVPFVAELPGTYAIEVRAVHERAPLGGYRVRLSGHTPATADDVRRVAAARRVEDADRAIAAERGELLAGAIADYAAAADVYDELDEGAPRAEAVAAQAFATYLHDGVLAIPIHHQATDLQLDEGDDGGAALTLFWLSELYKGRGEFARGEELAAWAVTSAEVAGDAILQGRAEVFLGCAQAQRDRYQEGLVHFERARGILRAAGPYAFEGEAVNHLAEAHHVLGDLDRAQSEYEEARDLYRRDHALRLLGPVTFELGRVYESRGDDSRAIAFHLEALAIERTTGDRWAEAYTLDGLGNLERGIGRPASALQRHLRSYALQRELGDRRGQAQALTFMGSAYMRLGQPKEAVRVLKTAVGILRDLDWAYWQWVALFRLAQAYDSAGDLGASLRTIREAQAISDSLRARIADAHGRAYYGLQLRREYDSEVDVLVRMGRQDEALAASERSRSRALLESIDPDGSAWPAEVAAPLRVREHALRAEIGGLLRAAESGATGGEALLDRRVAEYEGLVRTVEARYPALIRAHPTEARVDLSGIVDDGTLLLAYHATQRWTYLWAITSRGQQVHVLASASAIDDAARRFREVVASHAASDADRAAAGRVLSHLVLGPVADQLDARRLVVMPDGGLHYIPFAALPLPGGSGRLLVEDHAVVTIPSVAVLRALRRPQPLPRPRRTLAVVADPVFDADDLRVGGRPLGRDLPLLADLRASADEAGTALQRLRFTRTEAEAIAALVPASERLVALDTDARRQLFLDGTLDDYRILHVASHGLLNRTHPARSGLVLSLVDAGGHPQDGFVRLRDIYERPIHAELVVLSACDTALGQQVPGEGLLGLGRAFLQAGARDVVASLWKVDDQATAALMERFYRAMLVDGVRPVEALRRAQASLRAEPAWRSPYFWAAFTAIGDWR